MKIRNEEIEIFRPCCFHSHFRSPAQIGHRFKDVARMNSEPYRHVVIEPNTYLSKEDQNTHIETAAHLDKYRDLVLNAADNKCKKWFLAKLTPRTTRQTVIDVKSTGGIGFKLYPDGVTYGSSKSAGGVSDFLCDQMLVALAEIQQQELILQIHGELPGTYCMDAEYAFHYVLKEYRRRFPGLKIFVEHITDRRTVTLVFVLPNTWGSLTSHHQVQTTDDVLGNVDHHCKPCQKSPEDMEMIQLAAMSGSDKFISGTDSAWHAWDSKHIEPCGCAGVFNPGEINIPFLVQHFMEHGRGEQLENFTSIAGIKAYGVKGMDFDETDTITLVRNTKKEKVPGKEIYGATPFLCGTIPEWKIAS